MTVEYEVAEPASWDKEQIESRRNEGSWCCDNAMDELERLPGCLCGQAHFEYLGDTSDPYLCEK
jgi:hypothetical protein